MSLVAYDELFDKKVRAGAEALLRERGVTSESADYAALHDRASGDARLVLLTAARIQAVAGAGE